MNSPLRPEVDHATYTEPYYVLLLQGNALARHESPVEDAEPLHRLLVCYLHAAPSDLAKLSGEKPPSGRGGVVELVVYYAGGHLGGGVRAIPQIQEL